MFPVEIRISERDEDVLTARMTAMREWLDHRRVEPSSFRYTFTSPGILFRVDFKIEEETTMFAREFGGSVAGETLDVAAIGRREREPRSVAHDTLVSDGVADAPIFAHERD